MTLQSPKLRYQAHIRYPQTYFFNYSSSPISLSLAWPRPRRIWRLCFDPSNPSGSSGLSVTEHFRGVAKISCGTAAFTIGKSLFFLAFPLRLDGPRGIATWGGVTCPAECIEILITATLITHNDLLCKITRRDSKYLPPQHQYSRRDTNRRDACKEESKIFSEV